jgi:hypothetical protein
MYSAHRQPYLTVSYVARAALAREKDFIIPAGNYDILVKNFIDKV